MQINFKTKKLQKTVADLLAMKKNYGAMAKTINIRLNELKHTSCLENMKLLPHTNCHKLIGNYEGKFAISISVNHRIIFEPANNPLPCKDDGGLDLSKIDKITILEIGIDYH